MAWRFRWAVCQLDALRACKKVSAIRSALTQLPKTLDETYARILGNISESDIDEALSILRWIAFSNRPLTLQELAEAAVVKADIDCIDPDDRLCCAEDVLRICQGLLSLSTEKLQICSRLVDRDVVRFAHFSVLEYLTSDRAGQFRISDKSSNEHISKCCFSYLLQTCQLDVSAQSLEDYPLLRYCAEYWFKHFQKQEGSPLSNKTWSDRLYKFFYNSGTTFINWLRIWDPDPEYPSYRFSKTATEFPSALRYASFYGFLDITKRLLETQRERYNEPKHFIDAMRGAAMNGHYELTQLLIESGADASMKSKYKTSPLIAACIGGHYQTVLLLLDHGAEINSLDYVSTALYCAAEKGHDQIVDLLFKRGADANMYSNESGGSPLQVAIHYGCANIALRLLQEGADINTKGGLYGEPLSIACAKGYKDMVQLLINKGADVNGYGSEENGNPLMRASAGGFSDIVEILLKAGAAVSGSGGTTWGSALEIASTKGYFDVVKLLAEAGADVNYFSWFPPHLPLEAAEENGDERIIQLLLDHGAKRKQELLDSKIEDTSLLFGVDDKIENEKSKS